MSRLLYLQASPRGERSKSRQAADAFVDAYRAAHPDDEVTTIDLFEADLPAFDGPALDAKYAILHGQEATDEQAAAWRPVVDVIQTFKAADKYVLAVPMWNFGIPYRLKQYIDILVQPGYTFSFSPEEGYKGLVTGKPALVVYARGGDYTAPEAANLDLQKPYVERVLGFIGFTDIRSIVVEPTLQDGPDVAARKLEAAVAEAREMAESF